MHDIFERKPNPARRAALLLPVLCLLLAVLFSGCARQETDPPEPSVPEAPVLPAELSVLRENLTLLATNEAAKLSANDFSASFLDMIRSGSGPSYKEYEMLRATLNQLALTYSAYQVYLLTDLDDDLTSLEVAVASNANGGAPICTWEEHHKAEYALIQAYNGSAAADMFARTWNADSETPILTWTAYAPVLDANGSVACILAFEYPLTQLLTAYPEWNRMNDAWNGVIDPPEENESAAQ